MTATIAKGAAVLKMDYSVKEALNREPATNQLISR